MPSDDDLDLRVVLRRLSRFLAVNVRWLSRLVIGLIALLLIAHHIYPPAVDWLGEHLGFSKPSLATSMAVILLVFIVERVFVIEEAVNRPPEMIEAKRDQAYRRLGKLMEQYGVRSAALLQVSGQSVIRLLRDLGERWPQAKVRLLLMHPEAAKSFDADHHPDHDQRILTTCREIELMESDYPGFHVETRFYDTPPALCAVIIDADLIALSWYRLYRDREVPGVVRIRGHQAPAVVGTSSSATPLITFATAHFEEVWATAAHSSAQAPPSTVAGNPLPPSPATGA